jgi:hypothetical protein
MSTSQYKPFEQALLFGQRAQDRVADILRSAGGFANKMDDRGRYDFELVFHHTHRVEVKNEDHYSDTGNICIETRQGYPLHKSGIAVSEAVICVHTLCDMCALYRKREMLEYLRQETRMGRLFEQRFSKADNNNRGFILPIAAFNELPWFDHRSINTLPESPLWQY